MSTVVLAPTAPPAPPVVVVTGGLVGASESGGLRPGEAPVPEPREVRLARALAFAVLPAMLGGLLTGGALGVRWDPRLALLIALSGGPLAGWIGATERADRIFTSVAAMLGAVGIVLGAAFYATPRESVTAVELLVPMLGGSLPGLAALLAFRKLAPRLVPRFVLAVGAVAAAIVVIASC